MKRLQKSITKLNNRSRSKYKQIKLFRAKKINRLKYKRINLSKKLSVRLGAIKQKVELDINTFIKKKFKSITASKYDVVKNKRSPYEYEYRSNSKLKIRSPNKFKKFLLFKNRWKAQQSKNIYKISLLEFFKLSYRRFKQKHIYKYQKYLNVWVLSPSKPLILHLHKYIKNKKNLKTLFVKNQFKNFFNKNNLAQVFNLRRDLPYPNYLQLKSEIQRARVFRDVVNKESAYYNNIKGKPLVILISPKPKNIYVTIYVLAINGYKILWKKSTGMLQKVEGQLHLAALIELFNKINIFLTKNFLQFRNPLKLLIKSTKYYGTSNIIQNFVRLFQNNLKLNNIYFMYKYRKRFNFFSNYGTLINDSVFNYLSSIWIKFLKLIRKSQIPISYTRSTLKTYSKFFALQFDYAKRKFKINHFLRLKRLKRIKLLNSNFKNLLKVKRAFPQLRIN